MITSMPSELKTSRQLQQDNYLSDPAHQEDVQT